MKIRLIWVGKTKEQFIRDGVKKYLKLIRPYADLQITEIKEAEGKNIQRMVEKESERILKLNDSFVLLDERGKTLSSVGFAEFIGKQKMIQFVLGGAYGVSDEVRNRATDTIALSKMTFTHEMSRLFLMEQLFRAFTIVQRRGYHH